MATSFTAYERETIINFNEEDDMATVFTRSLPRMRHMDALVLKNCGAVCTKHLGDEATYTCPVELIRMPTAPRQYSEEAMEKLRENGRQLAQRRREQG